ncbi:hypothetical protein HPB51_026241 [Rhipicephalus microplus]|uniref:Clip domain-containing protein n=1 Tax=Rhipicephalus microplus TaxID=6941 RepID=A0A9J6DYC6_RHIMP|nr:hypothetical protein HPB51_026241 [Rhipicephalus microplus]
MCVLLLALGLAALGSNLKCEAHFLGSVERGPCQAKNPLGRGFLDGTCMPAIKCKQILRGIVRLNFPVICGFELLKPIVCCPHMGHSAPGSGGKGPGGFRNPVDPFNLLNDILTNIPGLGSAVGGPHAGASPYVPTIPHLPHGGSFGFPINPQGILPGPEPHVPHQPLPPHGGGGSGYPIRPDNYFPDVGPQQPHGNSPGTGPVPPQPGSGVKKASPMLAATERCKAPSSDGHGGCVPESSCPEPRRERSDSCVLEDHVCCRQESRPQRSAADKDRMLAVLQENRLCTRSRPH